MHSTRKVYQTDIPNRKVNSTFYVSKRLHGRLSACAHGNGDVEKNVYATLSNWIIFLILCFCICPPYYVTNSIEFNLIWHSAGSIVWSFSIFLLVIISPARIWTIVYFCRFIQSFLVFYFNNAQLFSMTIAFGENVCLLFTLLAIATNSSGSLPTSDLSHVNRMASSIANNRYGKWICLPCISCSR